MLVHIFAFFAGFKIITAQASRHAFTRKPHSSSFLVKAWREAWAVMSHNIPCHLTTFNQSSVEPGYRRTRVCKFLIMCRVLIKCLGCMVPGGKGWLCFVSVVVKSFVVLIMDISLYLFADIAPYWLVCRYAQFISFDPLLLFNASNPAIVSCYQLWACRLWLASLNAY